MSAPGLSIVIPCFNEEEGVPSLAEKILPVLKELSSQRPFELIFVNDGSTDGTLAALEKTFAKMPETKILSHPENRNLGAALRTGMSQALQDLVAFLDADCTYEPRILLKMLEQDSDLVLASPYHPQGAVEGVPAWRLGLSRSLSLLYRTASGSHIHTYTGMVRLFRRSAFSEFQCAENDFTFVTLMTLWAVRENKKIAEVPALLGVRRTGVSKMRVLRVGTKHLKILWGVLTGSQA
ncbi:MAG TPA: glycosyltransferase family 2 protein [Bdellovibrionota bacterium]|jgi:dolichol-phosphate mannosyltransferase